MRRVFRGCRPAGGARAVLSQQTLPSRETGSRGRGRAGVRQQLAGGATAGGGPRCRRRPRESRGVGTVGENRTDTEIGRRENFGLRQ